MKRKFEVLFFDGHCEITDFDTVYDLVDELECCERDDINQIHELNENGTLGDVIWTEEEGLFSREFDLPCNQDKGYYDDEDEDDLFD